MEWLSRSKIVVDLSFKEERSRVIQRLQSYGLVAIRRQVGLMATKVEYLDRKLSRITGWSVSCCFVVTDHDQRLHAWTAMVVNQQRNRLSIKLPLDRARVPLGRQQETAGQTDRPKRSKRSFSNSNPQLFFLSTLFRFPNCS